MAKTKKTITQLKKEIAQERKRKQEEEERKRLQNELKTLQQRTSKFSKTLKSKKLKSVAKGFVKAMNRAASRIN